MTKNSNTRKKAEKTSTIQLNDVLRTALEIVDLGGTHALIIAMKPDETLLMNSTLGSYEQMHSLINRGMFELTINHHKHILSNIEEAKA